MDNLDTHSNDIPPLPRGQNVLHLHELQGPQQRSYFVCTHLHNSQIMVTMLIEKKTTLGYIIGVWRFIELNLLVTDKCFAGIQSWSPKHDTIKGFPCYWYPNDGKLNNTLNQHLTLLPCLYLNCTMRIAGQSSRNIVLFKSVRVQIWLSYGRAIERLVKAYGLLWAHQLSVPSCSARPFEEIHDL